MSENLIAPTESNVRYWSTRILDTLEEEKWNRSHLEAVIRELLQKDTEMSANDQARAVLRAIFELTDGCADGAPDASQHDKMCSLIAGMCRPFVKAVAKAPAAHPEPEIHTRFEP